MTAVGLALLSAFLFGAMSVGLRIGLRGYPDAAFATLCAVGGALLVSLVAVALEAPSRGIHAGGAWPFALAGLLQPGVGQLLVTTAIREAGASRASVMFGAAPLVSVTIALVALGEPVRAPLVVGAVLVAGGGIELAREPGRPEHLRRIGLVYAAAAMALFATRDNLLRWLSTGTATPPAVAAAASLVGGLLVVAVAVGPRLEPPPRTRALLPFVVTSLLFGISYVALFEAYYRGRVTVVSPLVATESLWAVVLSLVLLRRHEHVGRRIVLGALLVVAGSALIGAVR